MTETNDVSESEPATDEVVGEEAVAEPDPLAEIMAERDKIKDQLLRTAADFDNFRKRTRRDLDDAASRSREDLLREILPIFDNLERAVVAAETAADAASVAEGVAMVLRQFDDVGSRIGIERAVSVGERFDPQIHDAVQQMESSEHEAGTIMAEILPGYSIRGRLVRPAMVVVARPPANPGPEPEADAEAEAESESESESGVVEGGDETEEPAESEPNVDEEGSVAEEES